MFPGDEPLVRSKSPEIPVQTSPVFPAERSSAVVIRPIVADIGPFVA